MRKHFNLGDHVVVTVREFLTLAPLGLELKDGDGDIFSFDGLNYVVDTHTVMHSTWDLFEKDTEPVTSQEFIRYVGNDYSYDCLMYGDARLPMEVVKAPKRKGRTRT